MGLSGRYSLAGMLRSSRLTLDSTWKNTLVRSFFSEEQLDELGLPEEEIADYMIKHIVPFVKSHLVEAIKVRNESFDQFVADRLAEQGIVAREQQEKIKKVMQAMAAAKVQITDQTDTLEEQQNKIAELTRKLEAATLYLEERAANLEKQVIEKEAWKLEQELKAEAKFPKYAVDALRDLEEEVGMPPNNGEDEEKEESSSQTPSATTATAKADECSPTSKEMERILKDGMAEIQDLLRQLLAKAKQSLCEIAAVDRVPATLQTQPSELPGSPVKNVVDAATETDDSRINPSLRRPFSRTRPPQVLPRGPMPASFVVPPSLPPPPPSSPGESFGFPRSQFPPFPVARVVYGQFQDVAVNSPGVRANVPLHDGASLPSPSIRQNSHSPNSPPAGSFAYSPLPVQVGKDFPRGGFPADSLGRSSVAASYPSSFLPPAALPFPPDRPPGFRPYPLGLIPSSSPGPPDQPGLPSSPNCGLSRPWRPATFFPMQMRPGTSRGVWSPQPLLQASGEPSTHLRSSPERTPSAAVGVGPPSPGRPQNGVASQQGAVDPSTGPFAPTVKPPSFLPVARPLPLGRRLPSPPTSCATYTSFPQLGGFPPFPLSGLSAAPPFGHRLPVSPDAQPTTPVQPQSRESPGEPEPSALGQPPEASDGGGMSQTTEDRANACLYAGGGSGADEASSASFQREEGGAEASRSTEEGGDQAKGQKKTETNPSVQRPPPGAPESLGTVSGSDESGEGPVSSIETHTARSSQHPKRTAYLAFQEACQALEASSVPAGSVFPFFVESAAAARDSMPSPAVSPRPEKERTASNSVAVPAAETEDGCGERRPGPDSVQTVPPQTKALLFDHSPQTGPNITPEAAVVLPSDPPFPSSDCICRRPEGEGMPLQSPDTNAAESPVAPSQRDAGEVEQAQETACEVESEDVPQWCHGYASAFGPLPATAPPLAGSWKPGGEQSLDRAEDRASELKGGAEETDSGAGCTPMQEEGPKSRESRLIRMTQISVSRGRDPMASLYPTGISLETALQMRAPRAAAAGYEKYCLSFLPEFDTSDNISRAWPPLSPLNQPSEPLSCSFAPSHTCLGSPFRAPASSSQPCGYDASMENPASPIPRTASEGQGFLTPVTAGADAFAFTDCSGHPRLRPLFPYEQLYWAGVTDGISDAWRSSTPAETGSPSALPLREDCDGQVSPSPSGPSYNQQESYFESFPQSASRVNEVVRLGPGEAFWRPQLPDFRAFDNAIKSPSHPSPLQKPVTRVPLHCVGSGAPKRRCACPADLASRQPSAAPLERGNSTCSNRESPQRPVPPDEGTVSPPHATTAVEEPNEEETLVAATDASGRTPRITDETRDRGECAEWGNHSLAPTENELGEDGPRVDCSCPLKKPTGRGICGDHQSVDSRKNSPCGCPGRRSAASSPDLAFCSRRPFSPRHEPEVCTRSCRNERNRREACDPCGGGTSTACSLNRRPSFGRLQAIPLVRCHSPQARYQVAKLGVGGYPVYPSEEDLVDMYQFASTDTAPPDHGGAEGSERSCPTETLPLFSGGMTRSATDLGFSGDGTRLSNSSRRTSPRPALAGSPSSSSRGSGSQTSREDGAVGRRLKQPVPYIPIRGSKIGQSRRTPLERETLSSLAARNRRLENQVSDCLFYKASVVSTFSAVWVEKLQLEISCHKALCEDTIYNQRR
ncbi:proteophosphoglycan 5, related [Neospora caninum Liverpool]|uniref:Proteophosphoglycan 5, related n=1 Tax=Neospora caninum (strain Liverpool) TaxID=572307 RepID=F0VC92_NEOCL|nr:proteophosphoglycan 5, related [Neospora caninum Liverpool]CBZ51226.1 proteophosphoglycan 5, related [Neospora caninum Liverpool]CEL68540.1 TPA: Proteophosphoglycan 5, related [Neospora caninum Liverpool]|eukprot:XP_003881259.1 proteophosphoglycan 5, related [Neospora caninum Liverpool]